MNLDYNSLLVSVGFSAAGLAVAILGGWLLVRSERFMLTWAVGLLFLVGNVTVYSSYIRRPTLILATVSMLFLMVGFSIMYGAAVQFVRLRSPLRPIACATIPSVIAVLLPMMLGLDGIGFFAANAGAGVIFAAVALEYWRGRREAPVPILSVSFLYALVAVSFFLCAGMIAYQGNVVLSGPPNNWTENLNLIVALVGMTGIGALSLALNQWRLAARHRLDARTDPLTGLLNRRALFEIYGARPLDAGTAVIVFDLDHFKAINDRHGHAVGDEVLRRFAGLLTALSRSGDSAARLGGEEFALILPGATQMMAAQVAELVRRRFESMRYADGLLAVPCTVSAGLAVATEEGASFEGTLSAADRALYRAKSDGRNRIVPASRQLAG